MTSFPLVPEASGRHIITLLRQRMAVAPRTKLLSIDQRHLSAEDLLAAGEVFAKAFIGAGLQAGDRVAIQCGNRPELLAALIGCALTGLVLLPVNTASRGAQLAYYVKNSQARVFIADAAQFAHIESAYATDADAMASLLAVWSLDGEAAATAIPKLVPIDDVPLAGSLSPVEPVSTSPAVVIYTSGTSGPSKGVLCSHAQLYWWGHYSLQNLGIRSTDVLYTCLPLFHINALNTFFQALLSGGSMVIGAKFSVTRFYADLARAEATVTFLLGAMLPMLLSRDPAPDEREHQVRVVLAPGATARHYEAFEQRTGIEVLDGYGSTESNFAICTPLGEPRPGWMGKVTPGFQARVVDADDNEVPHGTAGELILRSDQPFAFAQGYLGMPEKTVEAWRNLWLHTGDRVLRDEDGYFKFIDRLKDSIRRRGENISSYEVEQVFMAHPAIAEVAAFAAPSELAEDEVMCALVLREGASFDPLELIKWCEPRLPYFAVPRFLRTMTALPRTENGKVQKYKLRAEGRTPDTWDLTSSGHTVKR